MRPVAQLALIALALASPTAGQAPAPTPHPLENWIRADVVAFGPGMWSVSIRKGGYYSGSTSGQASEFTGQLTPPQREALSRLAAKLPRQQREYRFGTDPMEGPSLSLSVHDHLPTTRYWAGVVKTPARQADAFLALVEIAEFIRKLVPTPGEMLATPWRDARDDSRSSSGRTSGCT
jgi:hypothetical protein